MNRARQLLSRAWSVARTVLAALAAVCAAALIFSAAAHGLAGVKRASDAVPGLVRWPL
jgi:hypothetical protein